MIISILRVLADTLFTIQPRPFFYKDSQKCIERMEPTNRHSGVEHWTTGAHVWPTGKLNAWASMISRDLNKGMI
jgi:hypothetical protein